MNNSRRRVAALVLMLCAEFAFSQNNPQTIAVPLSRPGEPVALKISILSARIEVIGEDRKDAEFVVTLSGGGRKLVTPSGTKTLAGGSYELRVDENDNTISVVSDWRAQKVEVIARIPRRADLDLSTTNEGEIIVRGIVGNLQLQNVNGPISATDIKGSVIAESMNDTITVSLASVIDNAATALSSLNGDISLSLPANAGVELHVDNAQGEIESEFEMDVKPSKPVIERKQGRGSVSVRVENAIIAAINGGGPVIRMKTLNGNIRISRSGK